MSTDSQFYVKQTKEGIWELKDCDVVTQEYATIREMRAFIKGLWRGMAIFQPVTLVCSFFASNGTMVEQMKAEEELKDE